MGSEHVGEETEAVLMGRNRERIDVLDFLRHPPGRLTDSQRVFVDQLIAAIERGQHVGGGLRLYDESSDRRTGCRPHLSPGHRRDGRVAGARLVRQRRPADARASAKDGRASGVAMLTTRQRIEAAERGSWGESPTADLPRSKVTVRLRLFGQAGVRDPETPCDCFVPGEPSGQCKTDGHYMCLECEHAEVCECGQIEARCECPDEGEQVEVRRAG